MERSDGLEREQPRRRKKEKETKDEQPTSPRSVLLDKDIRVFPHAPRKRESFMSSMEDIDIHSQHFTGIVNLFCLMLTIATIVLFYQSYNERGILLDFRIFLCMISDVGACVVVLVYSNCLFMSSYVLFKLKIYGKLTEGGLFFLYVTLQVLIIGVPTVVIWTVEMAPMIAMFTTICICILSLKLHSFFFTNYYYVQRMKRLLVESEREILLERESLEQYDYTRFLNDRLKKIVRFKYFFYFYLSPTLTYEHNYPHSRGVRVFYVLKEFGAAAGILTGLSLIFIQFVLPGFQELHNEERLFNISLGIMQVAIPSMICWLMGFFAFFHCICNGWSEIIGFDDRQFYLDWWNSEDLEEFWRKWNILTHEWMLRHIYIQSYKSTKKLLRSSMNRQVAATFLTFFFSGILHEFAFSISFHTVRPYFLAGMFVQAPFVLLGHFFKHKRWGNILVWVNLFFGQPCIEFMYMRNWFHTHPGFFCLYQTLK